VGFFVTGAFLGNVALVELFLPDTAGFLVGVDVFFTGGVDAFEEADTRSDLEVGLGDAEEDWFSAFVSFSASLGIVCVFTGGVAGRSSLNGDSSAPERSIIGTSAELKILRSSAESALVKSNFAASAPGTCAEMTPKNLSPT
jgi:hypothetical protein